MLLGKIASGAVPVFLACVLGGCRSIPSQPAMDFSGPGWVVREGQAVWKPGAKAVGVAGELLVAIHPDGRRVVRFTKTPIPFVVAQCSTNGWQVQFVPRNKTRAGRGEPPARLIWLHLPEDFAAKRYDQNLFAGASKPDGSFSFWNIATGEIVEGYLIVTTQSRTHLVRSGDSLMTIARMYGVTVQAINAANPGEWRNWFRVGRTIHIPPSAPPP